MSVFRRVELAELAVWLHLHQVLTWISISTSIAIGQIRSNKMRTKNQGPGVDLALSQAAKPWFHQYLDPYIGTICGGLFCEHVFWGQIRNLENGCLPTLQIIERFGGFHGKKPGRISRVYPTWNSTL